MSIDKSAIEKEINGPVDKISIIKLVDLLIEYAYQARASDIHIDPGEDKVKIRLRIDGVMQTVFAIDKSIQEEIISRIKVLSDLRIDEHQAPQDGRFKVSLTEKAAKVQFDVRVSIMPTYYGENAVLRLLVEQGRSFGFEDIGLSEKDYERVKRAIKRTFGMILVTGPTGSGKTTTLYTILKTLNKPGVSIITIEDPIEYSLEGTNQIQVNSKTELTFANGLRSILRQDPNIIMVGEIRDQETGHLLLSTLHTNDSATALPRLLDMKIEPFLIASTVNVVVGQRLVRKICVDCKAKKALTESEAKTIKNILPNSKEESLKQLYTGKGCKVCDNTGYLGRIGIYEVLEVTEAIRTAIVQKQSAADIRKIAMQEGMTTILEDGLKKAEQGITTIEEVLRVMNE